MTTLKFNRLHKNGWHSYRLAGVPGAVFVDSKILTDEAKANPAAEIDVNLDFKAAGADATAKEQEKLAKKLEREQVRAQKAEAAKTRAEERLAKLQAQADKAKAKLASVSGSVDAQ